MTNYHIATDLSSSVGNFPLKNSKEACWYLRYLFAYIQDFALATYHHDLNTFSSESTNDDGTLETGELEIARRKNFWKKKSARLTLPNCYDDIPFGYIDTPRQEGLTKKRKITGALWVLTYHEEEQSYRLSLNKLASDLIVPNACNFFLIILQMEVEKRNFDLHSRNSQKITKKTPALKLQATTTESHSGIGVNFEHVFTITFGSFDIQLSEHDMENIQHRVWGNRREAKMGRRMCGTIAKNVQLSDGRDSYLALDDQVGWKSKIIQKAGATILISTVSQAEPWTEERQEGKG